MRHVCPVCGDHATGPAVCADDGATFAPAASDRLLGESVGSWRVARLLGAGGMGRVYLGVHPTIGSRVAIKVLSHDAAANRDLVERFFNEARAVNLIRHERIADVIDLAFLDDGRPYIVMEHVPGSSLAAVLADSGPLPLGTLADLLAEVLAAVGAAHAAGIVHRDLKPDNILVTPDGHAKVLDFGIAKLAPEVGGHVQTHTGIVIGTPAYMAPEQARSEHTDHRTDLYALGVVLYEGATGQRPFAARAMFDLLKLQIEAPPRPPRTHRPEIPEAFEAVILRALAKDPNARFATAAEMAAALVAATRDLPATARPALRLPAPEPPRLAAGERVHGFTGTAPLGPVRADERATVLERLPRSDAAPPAPAPRTAPTVADRPANRDPAVRSSPRAPRRRWPWLAGAAVLAAGVTIVAITATDDRTAAVDAGGSASGAPPPSVDPKASLLVERARQLVVKGLPARAAPLLAAARDLGATEPYLEVLEGQAAAALPAARWSRAVPAATPLVFVDDERVIAGSATLSVRDGSPLAPASPPDPAASLQRAIAEIRPTGKIVTAAAASSGAYLAIATADDLAIWQAKPRRVLATAASCGFPDNAQVVKIVTVTETGIVIGLCSPNADQIRELVVLDPSQLRDEVRTPFVRPADVDLAATSRDGRTIGVVDKASARVRFVRDFRERAITALPEPASIAVSADGQLVAAGTAAGFVQIWEAESGREIAVVTTTRAAVALAFAPDSQTLVATDASGTARAWSMATLARVSPIPDRDAASSRGITLAQTTRGARVIAASDRALVSLDREGRRASALQLPVGFSLDTQVTVTPDGRLAGIAHGGKAGSVLVVDRLPAPAQISLPDRHPHDMAISPDADFAIVDAELIDTYNQKIVGALAPVIVSCKIPRADRAVCLTRPKIDSSASDLVVYGVPDRKPLGSARLPFAPIAAFATHGDRIYAAGCRDRLGVVDLSSGEIVATIALEVSRCARAIAIS